MEDYIFHFNDAPALKIQENGICVQLHDDFWTRVLKSDANLLPIGWLSSVRDELKYTYVWAAPYASVVLVRESDSRHASVSVIGLDGWSYSVHSSVEGRESIALPDVCKPAILTVGSVETKKVDELLKEFKRALKKSEKDNKGSRRGQTDDHQGNQKTPSFVRTLLVRSMLDIDSQLPIQGGTTDVGMHTGCVLRNTSFPLVQSVVHELLRVNGERDDELFHKCLAMYMLSHLKDVHAKVTEFSPRGFDRVMKIIRDVRKHLEQIKDADFKSNAIQCLRNHHTKLLDLRPGGEDVPPLVFESVPEICDRLRSPSFPDIPDLTVSSDLLTRMAAARIEAQKNLEWTEMNISLTDCSGNLQDSWVEVSKANRVFWTIALDLGKEDAFYEICNLRGYLAIYLNHIALIRKNLVESKYVMAVTIASYELLAIWICFCWAQRATEKSYPMFLKYGTALDAEDLRHIVLDDERSIAAADSVRTFLRKRSKPRKPFRKQSDTLKFALEFGISSKELKRIHKQSLQEANRLIEERWQEIVFKQQQLSTLDDELQSAKKKRRSAQVEFDEARSSEAERHYDHYGRQHIVYTTVYYEKKESLAQCQQIEHDLRLQINNIDQTPDDLILGLPRSKEVSMQWLFFLFMPEAFRDLCFLAHQAQSKLWAQVPKSKPPKSFLLDWFDPHRTSVPDNTPSESILRLGTDSKYPKRSNPNIRQYNRETGVTFPDSFSLVPAWMESDPFASGRTEEPTTILFTEKLPPNIEGGDFMQQFLTMVPSQTRENESISRRERKPDWLTHEQFLAFTSLRVGPYSQIRNLVGSIGDNLLPFDITPVHILVKQLLFHIGENDWRVDLTGDFRGKDRLFEGIRQQLNILRESPKDCDRLLLFGVISSYFAQFEVKLKAVGGHKSGLELKFRELSLEFVSVARGWADDVAEEVKHEERVSPAIYAKQAKLYGYAVLCNCYGELDLVDLLALAELIVTYRSKVLYASTNECSESLDQPIMQVMASRIDSLVPGILQNKNHLTKCLSLVIDDVPENLQWSQISYHDTKTTCFEAAADHLYSINILNGFVLVDGVPPGLLPSSIIDDPIYIRSFGRRNFEMIAVGLSHYRATRRIDDQYTYEFQLDSSGHLHILEVDHSVSPPRTLLLLDRQSLDLPPLLIEEYTHWYSDVQKCIVLRKPSFSERSIRYVITKAATYIIPVERRETRMPVVLYHLHEYYRLLMGSTSVSELLSAFELECFIHVTVDWCNSELRFALPRYRLSFTLRSQVLSSDQFNGFSMQDPRSIDNTLPGFRACVALAGPKAQRKILLNDGVINHQAKVEIPEKWQESLLYHIYDVHGRFEHLMAMDRLGRLHLAGLYASLGSSACDRRYGMPAADVATQLLRQSWKNDPLSEKEKSKLLQVASHSNLSATLRLTCNWLWRSSNSMNFVHGREDPEREALLDVDALATDEYQQSEYASRLSSEEEKLLLGLSNKRLMMEDSKAQARMPRSSEIVEYVHGTERDMCSWLTKATRPDNGRFPLDRPATCGDLEKSIYNDLEESYQAYCSLPQTEAAMVDGTVVKDIIDKVRKMRQHAECAISGAMGGGGSDESTLSLVSGSTRTPTPIDLTRTIFDPLFLGSMNPSLDVGIVMEIQRMCIDWGVLCVFEDKLCRIADAVDRQDIHALTTELECTRVWSIFDHPRWLAFEVEQQLQIRPYQFFTFEQLQQQPGSVLQLNMGKGKTRVIVPMMILDMVPYEYICRVNLLPSIFNEAMDYFRIVLTASVQQIPIYSLPFHRGVPLNESLANQLSDEIDRIVLHGGALLATPQHRNSLLLKQHDQDVFIHSYRENSFVDILDESDAILHHDFQLVYALGTQAPLPGGSVRWLVLQALLLLLVRSENEEIADLVNDKCLTHRENNSLGCFPKIRFLQPFHGSERVLAKILCTHLVSNPPRFLRWMKDLPENLISTVILVGSSPECSDVMGKIQSHPLLIEKQAEILALRCLLAFGVLFHGLESRYRVNYGLNELSATNMAVPYSAADTPKTRAQYSHPDMEIVYTCLSYLHEGLSERQLKDALRHLQKMGPTAQNQIYSEWIDAVKNDVPLLELGKFDEISKVDTDNKPQLYAIHRYLGNCMEAIFFWTNNFIYPNDTYHFPSKRATSAWNLCGETTIGFSGTDDNKCTLPLPIEQLIPKEPALRATNGEMIQLVLSCTLSTKLLKGSYPGSENLPLWKEVLTCCVDTGVRALIDVGGLMAGAQNSEVAKFLVQRLGSEFKGVVFFDNVLLSWTLCQKEHQRPTPLRSASYTESECFVYFDESRCRGSDMKLRQDAVALVTIDSHLTKDKFLQGCARMRMLRRGGQCLILAGTPESLSADTTVKQILEKIIRNTAAAASKGLMTYFHRGLEYDTFPSEIQDDIALEAMYGKQFPTYRDMSAYLEANYDSEPLTNDMVNLVDYCKSKGKDANVKAEGIGEECEQELEHEEDFEEQGEVELERQKPFVQEDWEWSLAFSEPKELFQSFISLKHFVRGSFPALLSGIEWSEKVFCTPNFCNTICDIRSKTIDMSWYARPVDAMLILADGRTALLSKYELDKLLPHWWEACRDHNKEPKKAVLQHLFTTVKGTGFGNDIVPIPLDVLISIKLFRGCVLFSPTECRALARVLRLVRNREESILHLLAVRGRQGYYERSNLEEVATKVHLPKVIPIPTRNDQRNSHGLRLGAPTAPSSSFGATPASGSKTDATSQQFGNATLPFGAQLAPSNATTPSFGANHVVGPKTDATTFQPPSLGTSAPAFGSDTAPQQFGNVTPSFGAQQAASNVAAPSRSSFGAQLITNGAPAFGSTASSQRLGNSAASPSFGAPFTFGSSTAAPSFGVPTFGSNTPNAPSQSFGAAPAFGAPSAAPAFGAIQPFGATNVAPAFGSNAGVAATPSFGSNAAAPTQTNSAPTFGAKYTDASASESFSAATPFGATRFTNTATTTFNFTAQPNPPFGQLSDTNAPTFGGENPAFGSASDMSACSSRRRPTRRSGRRR